VGAISPPETSGWFAHEIHKVEDLDGLKMRFFGLGGTVMTKLGVAVNFLPPGEIFPALEKGVIDATEYSTPSVDEDIGLYKIAKFNYFPGWHQQASAFELLINKDVWNRLSASQQTIIEMACQATVVHSLANAEATQAVVMLRNERERGVKNVTWPPEILRVMEEKWNEVAAEKSAEDAFFKKVYDDFSKFRREYAVWGSRAYLPRVLSAE
jgi:TRAP-type mannitol/chloroaromatic compound transport system substrate-binding protein